MFPETVGRSLEEVEEIFKQGHTFTAWKISKDVGKKTLAEVVEKSKEIEVGDLMLSFAIRLADSYIFSAQRELNHRPKRIQLNMLLNDIIISRPR